MIGSDKAVSLGLIVTELVINAIKYAFPVARTMPASPSAMTARRPTGRSRFPTTASARHLDRQQARASPA
jgi:hypothetical protein